MSNWIFTFLLVLFSCLKTLSRIVIVCLNETRSLHYIFLFPLLPDTTQRCKFITQPSFFLLKSIKSSSRKGDGGVKIRKTCSRVIDHFDARMVTDASGWVLERVHTVVKHMSVPLVLRILLQLVLSRAVESAEGEWLREW